MNTTVTSAHKILLVDDDPDFLLQLQLPLQAAGYQVIPADGQQAAEKALSQTWPDLAIVDLMMEHMDGGLRLCHRIKTQNPKTPIIMVTAVTRETGFALDANTPEERSWIKADAVLDKPVRFEQLRREVDRLLRSKA